jgi:uncharacterized protein involved in outer membrane biogenesis
VTRIERKEASARSPRHWGLRHWSGLTAIVVALLAMSIVAFAVLSGVTLQTGAARSDIERQLADLIGLPISVAGSSSLSLLPKTQIRIDHIRIGVPGNGGPPPLTVEAVVADLDLFDALLGRTSIEKLTVIRPEVYSIARFVTASTGEDGEAERQGGATAKTGRRGRPGEVFPSPSAPAHASGHPAYREISHYFAAFLTRLGDLRRVDVRDGVFRMAPGAGARRITGANFTIAWPSPDSAARMSGSYVWNGEPTEVDLKLAAPLEFLRGGPSAIDFSLSAPPLDVAFSGSGSTRGRSGFNGALKVSTPSLTRSVRWLGDPQATMPDLGAMAIDATLESTGQKLKLDDATVTIVGYSGRGAMEMLMAPGAVPAVSGTLAFDRLDLTGFAQALAPLPRNVLDFQQRISTGYFDKLDLDLRISAGEGAIGSVPITDLAATVKFKDGVAMFDVGDASMLGGQGQARIAIDSRVRSPTAKGSASVTGIDTARLLAAVGVDAVGVSGPSDLYAELGMPVTDWSDIARRLHLSLEIVARGGTLSGFDPEVFLAPGTKPFALATEASTIPFETLRARLTSNGPGVTIEALSLIGAAGRFEAAGAVSTATSEINLSGAFTPRAGTNRPALGNSQPVSFRMTGEWPRPTVTTGPPVAPM